MRVNLNDAGKYVKGGGSFFKLTDGQSKHVRFLYNTVADVENSALIVHEFTGSNFATIDCCREEGEPLDACKWCASGNGAVTRIVIPMYVVEDNEIQYWKKSGTWVQNNLIETFKTIPSTAPISGQEFILSRKGSKMQDTVYTIAPNLQSPNDMKAANQFGEVKDPFELNIIKPNDFDFNPQQNSQPNTNAVPQATRRTTDVF